MLTVAKVAFDLFFRALVHAAHGIQYNTWRLASMPDSLTDTEIERLLNAFERTSSIGRRDYAMALRFLSLFWNALSNK